MKNNKVKFAERIKDIYHQNLLPLDPISLDDWSRTRYYLPPTISPKRPGIFTPEPYQIEPLQMMGDPTVRKIVICSAEQMLKSTLVTAFILWSIKYAPAPTLLALPTDKLVTRTRTKLKTLLVNNKEIGQLILGNGHQIKSTNQRLIYPGGFIEIGSAKSAAFTSDITAKYVIMDETDRYHHNPDGDPVSLLSGRASSIPDHKIIMVSTPTDPDNHIWAHLQRTDMRKPYIECPHCHHPHLLSLNGEKQDEGRLIWSKDLSHIAFVCPHCGAEYSEIEKQKQVENTLQWIPTNPENQDIGYCNINKLYAHHIKARDLITKYRDALKNPDELRSFVNVSLALPWSPNKTKQSQQKNIIYKARSTTWDTESIPDEILLLTAGGDIQKDRIELSVWGWSDTGKSYLVDHQIFAGNILNDEPWEALELFVKNQIYTTQSGRQLQIRQTLIDQQGYDEQRQRRKISELSYLNVYRCNGYKGTSQHQPIHKLSKGTHVIHTSKAKDTFFASLDNNMIEIYHSASDEVLEQLISEKRTIRNGVVKYIQTRDRNEAIDCYCYAYGALISLHMNLTNPHTKQMLLSQKPRERTKTILHKKHDLRDRRHQSILERRKRKLEMMRQGKL